MSLQSPLLVLLAAAFSLSIAEGAEDTATPGTRPPATEKQTVFDRIWGLPTIYKNEGATFLNEFRFVGRAQFDVYDIDSDRGADQDWIVRRLRIGGKARFFHDLDLHVEVDLNPQTYPVYRRLTDAYLAWKFSDALKLTIGKQGARFTLDGATSSTELITIDRSNLANNLWFPTEYISGITLSGKAGQWQYTAGYFSGGEETSELGNFNAGTFGLGSIGYDFGRALGVKKALLRADYVYNEPNSRSTATRPFEHIGALVLQLDAGRWGLSADVAAASGFGTQSDAWGTDVMPWLNITDKLQLVARYTFLSSEGPRGVRLARYDTAVTTKRGDEYHEIYGGVNYYFHGHKLKLQTGIAYTVLNDSAPGADEYHAWQWTSGLRISF